MSTLQTILLASPQDKKSLDLMMTQLRPYALSGTLALWNAWMMLPGARWEKVMAEQIGNAHLVLALISANFLSDDRQIEYFRAALARQEQGLCITVSVLISPCLWEYALINTPTVILPRNKEEIGTWTNRSAAYKQVGKELQEIIERISRRFIG